MKNHKYFYKILVLGRNGKVKILFGAEIDFFGRMQIIICTLNHFQLNFERFFDLRYSLFYPLGGVSLGKTFEKFGSTDSRSSING